VREESSAFVALYPATLAVTMGLEERIIGEGECAGRGGSGNES
jgi:hypothetical protein